MKRLLLAALGFALCIAFYHSEERPDYKLELVILYATTPVYALSSFIFFKFRPDLTKLEKKWGIPYYGVLIVVAAIITYFVTDNLSFLPLYAILIGLVCVMSAVVFWYYNRKEKKQRR